MPILKVDRETVVNEWELPDYGSKEHGVEVISDEMVDKDRWSVQYELTVKIQGKFYQSYYRVGATEYQDERPWEYDKEVTFVEVEPVETVVVKYVAVKD